MNYYKYALFAFLIFLLLPWTVSSGEKKLPKIEIKPNIWGGASTRDIQKILNSAARQLWPHAHQDRLSTIKVERSRTGPIVLYRRGEKGEYLMRLDSEKTYWSQYAFQFAHEFGHIICGYKKGDQSNLWFEETLCETASLFALRGMTEEWKAKPPYPNWKSYGKEFAKYAQKRITKYPWPKNRSLGVWYKERKHSLSQKPADRGRNVQLASQLLPLFEEKPSGWGACAFINIKKSNQKRSFSTYLEDWKKNCKTDAQKEFVKKLAGEFSINL
jgi:hypothetical protein